MKRPPVFITYFQSPFQIVHGYQVLQSEYFFQKNGDHFNLISIFPSCCQVHKVLLSENFH